MTQKVEITQDVTVRASATTRDSYGPGVHEVPDDVADDLLSHRAVTRPDQSDDEDAAEDADEDADDATDWDATAFVDQHHATVRGTIEDGTVDDRLDAVEAAETDRDSPRDSVLSAIENRRQQGQG